MIHELYVITSFIANTPCKGCKSIRWRILSDLTSKSGSFVGIMGWGMNYRDATLRVHVNCSYEMKITHEISLIFFLQKSDINAYIISCNGISLCIEFHLNLIFLL